MEAEGEIKIFFKNGSKTLAANTKIGSTLLEAAHQNGVPLEGACEGSLACSTCHVILPAELFDSSKISDRENDLLDTAYGLKPTSRLACQLVASPEMNEKTFEIPRCTRNLAVDGYKPTHH